MLRNPSVRGANSNGNHKPAHTASPTPKRALIGAGVGNALEWFDWMIYAQFSVLLSLQFFPSGNPVAALLSTLAVFGAGFLFRPLGGYLLSLVTDRRGRRTGMVVTILLMAGGTLLIGISPTYAQVGVLAPILLLVARGCQGMSAGGELAAVSTYLAEVSPPKRRGLYGSVLYISATVGSLAATGIALLLNATLSESQLQDWGWRLPFIFGALIGVIALMLRRNLHETSAFESTATTPRSPGGVLATLLRDHRADFLRLVLLAGLSGLWYYIFASYLPVYLTGRGLDASAALWANVIALVVFILSLPVVGAISDRYGRRVLILAFCAGAAITVVPLFALLEETFARQLILQTFALLIFALFAAIGPIAMAEQFPTEIRAVGLGLPYAIGAAIFGGTAPFIMQWLSEIGIGWVFPWYVAILAACTFVAMLTLRDHGDSDMADI